MLNVAALTASVYALPLATSSPPTGAEPTGYAPIMDYSIWPAATNSASAWASDMPSIPIAVSSTG